MKKLKILISLIIFPLLLTPFQSFAQTAGDISGNQYFVASVVKENGKNVIFIHKFMTKEFVRKLRFKIPNSNNIDKVKFSFTGKFLYAKQGNDYYIFDVINDTEVTKIYNAKQVVFAKNEDVFYTVKSGKLKSYDCNTGKQILEYENESSQEINKVVLSPNDKIIAGICKDKVLFWNANDAEQKSEQRGNDAKFSSDTKFITIVSLELEDVRFLTLKTENFYMERSFTSKNLLKTENVNGFGQPKLIPSRTSMSETGKYIALYTSKGNDVKIFIYNSLSGKKVFEVTNTANTSNMLHPQYWVGDHTLIAYGANMQAGRYNIQRQEGASISLSFTNPENLPELTPDKQKKNRIISNNYNFVVMQTYQNGKPVMYLKSTNVLNKKLTLDNVEFVSFSPDGKYIFVKKDNTVSVILAQQAEQSIATSKPVDIHKMDETMKTFENEKFVPLDAPAPRGYAYYYVNGTQQMALVDTAKVHLAFRSIQTNGNDVELKVNLVDKNGNLLTGAVDPNWQFVWCNLILQKPDNSVVQVQDFVVEEVHEAEPTAIALVLDHSGSMGTERANNVQYGAYDLVKEKKKEDAFMLIKYDDRSNIEAKLNTETAYIFRHLQGNGLEGYGGATALIDATYRGVLQLKNANKYKRKVVVLFTDGHENSSFYNKFDVIKEAVENNIEIHVIGFGDQINEQYLKSLAYTTGGTYNRLYSSDKLNQIFKDVDTKRRHYYSVKFKTDIQGKYIAMLQLCQDESQHDSIIVPFDNTSNKKRYDQRDPVPHLDRRSIKLSQFKKLTIPRKMQLTPVVSKKIKKDFEKIEFPDIQFSTSSSNIVKSDEKGLQEIADFMIKYPYVYLEIHGHTDNVGDPDANLKLSKDRAEAAKKLLIEKGVARGRLKAKGFGQTKPIASNETEEGRKQNRRIEFHIFQQRR